MNFKQISNKNNTMVLEVKDASFIQMNSIRRVIMDEVPTMAVEEIEFRQNSSALYDEIVAHRIGLIPLTTDLKAYNIPEKCSCNGEGCLKCQLKILLRAEGPCTVYASDLKPRDPKIKPAFDKIPIVKLLKGQVLELEATAVLGRGKNHSKWSPGHVYYQNIPDIKIGAVKNPKEVSASCPTKVFKGKDKLSVDDASKCILCNACVDVSGEKVTINKKTKNFILTIESFGQLSPKEMLTESLNVLDQKADELASLI